MALLPTIATPAHVSSLIPYQAPDILAFSQSFEYTKLTSVLETGNFCSLSLDPSTTFPPSPHARTFLVINISAQIPPPGRPLWPH